MGPPEGEKGEKRVKSRILALLWGVPATSRVLAADFSDPDWPCIQRKTPSLSIAQMWGGPPIGPEMENGWRDWPDAAALAPALAVRRTSLEEAERLIEEFAHRGDGTNGPRLSALFAGAFTLIERERAAIIGGVARYAHKQAGLADRIEGMRDELALLQAAAEPDFDRIEELEDTIAWDTRIFRDRALSLTYVCETPVILEKRIFALARAIAAHLE